MSEEIAIRAEGISKNFKLPLENHSSLKSKVVHSFKKTKGFQVQHALKNVSFEVKKGEFFGIVGRNGSGKSTLLKMLAGIYQPTEGKISIQGKLVPFIELGVGFNPELTGRENVFLNGALLGFSNEEVAKMYDEIVEFAELECFMDQKLKNYSSGMQVRLAFSMAVRANADILLIDEVLAVGDTSFQRKCYEYFERLKTENKTVVFVTHDMSAVERFCDRAMLINDSKVVEIGDTATITKQYSQVNLAHETSQLIRKKHKHSKSKGDITIESAVYQDNKITHAVNATGSDTIRFNLKISSRKVVNDLKMGITIKNASGLAIFATNTDVDNRVINVSPGKIVNVDVKIDNIFANGEYTLLAGLKSLDNTTIYYANENQDSFIAGGRTHEFAVVSPRYTIDFEDSD